MEDLRTIIISAADSGVIGFGIGLVVGSFDAFMHRDPGAGTGYLAASAGGIGAATPAAGSIIAVPDALIGGASAYAGYRLGVRAISGIRSAYEDSFKSPIE